MEQFDKHAGRGNKELGWFVGWMEKEDSDCFYPFAYTICDVTIDCSKRIPRVKELLEEANVMAVIYANTGLKNSSHKARRFFDG